MPKLLAAFLKYSFVPNATECTEASRPRPARFAAWQSDLKATIQSDGRMVLFWLGYKFQKRTRSRQLPEVNDGRTLSNSPVKRLEPTKLVLKHPQQTPLLKWDAGADGAEKIAAASPSQQQFLCALGSSHY
jgi:hypothetical protein